MLNPQITTQAITSCNSNECIPLSFLKPEPGNVLVAAMRLHVPGAAYYRARHQVSVIQQSRQIWIGDDHELPRITMPFTRRCDFCSAVFQQFPAKNGEFWLFFDYEFNPG
jgi:hypothetical protein